MPKKDKEVWLKLGNITVERADQYNWVVVEPGKTRYYSNLVIAIAEAADAAAEDGAKARNAWDWLRQYRVVAGEIEKAAQVFENTRAIQKPAKTGVSSTDSKSSKQKSEKPTRQNRSRGRG